MQTYLGASYINQYVLTDDYIESTPKQKEQCAILTTLVACMCAPGWQSRPTKHCGANGKNYSSAGCNSLQCPPVDQNPRSSRPAVQDKQQKRWKQLPTKFYNLDYAWTGTAFQEQSSAVLPIVILV